MGILLSALVAFLDAGKNITLKFSTKKFSSLITAWAWQLSALLILTPALVIDGIPEINTIFWSYSTIKIVLQVAASFLIAYAYKRSDISLALPMLALTPIITAGTSLFLSNEFPTFLGMIGILVIVIGLYLLKSEKDMGFFSPFKAVVSDVGVRSMLYVACIYGISSSIDKEGVLNSSPIFYSLFTGAGTAAVFTVLVFLKEKRSLKNIISFENAKTLLPAGLFNGFTAIAQMTAVSLTLASYVISIKRTSIIISSILAYFIFGEKLKGRLVPILIMVGGLIMIVFS